MDEINFRKWMVASGKSSKVSGDAISRLKKIEHELGEIDIDREYKIDRCRHLLSLFDNIGRNDDMKNYKTSLPIGRYHLSTYKYAVRLYVAFSKDYNKSACSNKLKSSGV